MRVIKTVALATNQGVTTYTVGDTVNDLEIKSIVECSLEYESSMEIGFRCLSSKDGKGISKNVIVEIWNAPVVVEYMEVSQ